MPREWKKARIINIEDCAPKTKRFFLEIQSGSAFEFRAGQFVTLDLPIGEKPKERWRSYSIASPPKGDRIVELVIVWLEGGKGTTWLFTQAGPGTEIDLMGPLGKFVLPGEIESDLCFIATGTGIAPFRSMLYDLYQRKEELKHDITLIYGTRYVEDILYYDELKALSEKWDRFHYEVTLSREKEEKWQGRKGYVHPVYEELFADKRPAHFYLCGWRDMVNEARERLMEMGYPSGSIHREIYD